MPLQIARVLVRNKVFAPRLKLGANLFYNISTTRILLTLLKRGNNLTKLGAPLTNDTECGVIFVVGGVAHPRSVARVYLKYDFFPTWLVLEDDAPQGMWDEPAKIFGLKVVGGADL